MKNLRNTKGGMKYGPRIYINKLAISFQWWWFWSQIVITVWWHKPWHPRVYNWFGIRK